jgi:arginase family enzyme
MPVAHLLNWIQKNSMNGWDWFNDDKSNTHYQEDGHAFSFLKPENIVYIGLRDLDKGEI